MSEYQATFAASAEPRFGASSATAPGGWGPRALGCALLALSLPAALSLATWSSVDPSLTNLSTSKPVNALGALGAIFSDLAITSLGLASILALLPPLYWAAQLLAGEHAHRLRTKLLLAPVGIIAVAAFLSSLPKAGLWPLHTGYGGLIGDVTLSFMTGTLASFNIEHTGIAAAVLSLALGLTLLWLALGLTTEDVRAIATRARRAYTPDSSWVAQLKASTSPHHPMPLDAPGAAEPELHRSVTPPPLSLHPEAAADWTQHHGAHRYGYTHGDSARAHGSIEDLQQTLANWTTDSAPPPSPAFDTPYVEERQQPPASQQRAANAPPVAVPVPEPQPEAVQPPPRLAYRLPSTSLLARTTAQRCSALEMSIAEKLRADRLRDVLAAFSVPGDVTQHLTGPVVTTFVFEPKAGTRTTRVMGLADDIAKALGVAAVRMQLAAGRSSLVIEMPHDDTITIGIRDLIEHSAFADRALMLPLALGATAQGEPAIADLAAMGSLLVAGKDKAERDGALRAIATSLAFRHTPDRLQLAFADVAGGLAPFTSLPHSAPGDVATDAADAQDLLAVVASEIDQRSLRLRSAAHARSITEYNARQATNPTDPTSAPMPYLVLLLDDVAALTATGDAAVNVALHRIARDGAAVGIHVVAAASTIDPNVLPPETCASFTTRIAFKLANRGESRDLLGDIGGEELLGDGDALATTTREEVRRAFGGGALSRLHTTSVTLETAAAVTAAIAASSHAVTLSASKAAPTWQPTGNRTDDALYDRAVALVRRERSVDTAHLRRGLQVTYVQALSLLEQMTQDRIVGAADDDGVHTVLIGRAA